MLLTHLTAGNVFKNLVRRTNTPLNIRLLFPRFFVLSASLFFAGTALAQSSEADPRPKEKTVNTSRSIQLETIPTAPGAVEEGRPRTINSTTGLKPVTLAPAVHVTGATNQLLITAIQAHLGASYHFNRTGPESFDCSGFVWRAFQDIGVDFQRGPARSYWDMFETPPPEQQFKFGTLVFFSNLSHVGIVVDEKGFYHSARHGGVMYSPFNDYWLSRIDGFRRVPIETLQMPSAAKTRVTKPAANPVTVEENNEP